MQKVEKVNMSQYKIEIKLSAKEVESYINKALNATIKKIKEPGFRPGKMPINMYINKYGKESVYPEAVDLIVNDIYPKIIEENKLQVIDYPNFDWGKMKISDKGFEVKGSVEVIPEFEMPNYKEIKETVTKKEAKVSKKEIKDEIDAILAKDSKYEAKKDYEAKIGDIVILDFEGFVDGKAFEGGKGESYSLTLGSNTFIPGFEDQLVGVKVGDKKDVEVTFPENYQAEDLKGKDAVFKCSIDEVQKRTLPRLTDKKIKELKEYDVNNKEELEKAIEEKLKGQKEIQTTQEYEDKILKKLVKESKLVIPKAMINQETDAAIKNLENNFKAQGITLEMYTQMTGTSLDALKEQFSAESKTRIEMQLFIDKVLKEEKIKVLKKDITARIKKLTKDYNMTEEEILKQLGGNTDAIERDLQYEKAREILFG